MDNTLMGDYSSFYNGEPYNTTAGNFGQNWLGQLTGFQSESTLDEWKRNEQSANNAFYRSMLTLNEQNRFSANEAEKSRAFNALEAQKNRDWQTQMSNTAYQRAMTDMKAAGLNPVLAFQQGGASSPTGSFATSSSPSSGGAGAAQGRGSSRGDSGSAGFGTLVRFISGLVSNVATVTSSLISASSNEAISAMKFSAKKIK